MMLKRLETPMGKDEVISWETDVRQGTSRRWRWFVLEW